MTRFSSRRDVLGASATVGTTALAGCLDSDQFDLGGTRYSGDLVVQNLMDQTHRYRLTVTEVSGESERTVLSRRYRIPGATALVYHDVIEGGGEYRFAVELLGEGGRSKEWSATVDACEGDTEMNVTISINRDQFNMTAYQCGQSVNLGNGEEIDTADASEYVLDGTAANESAGA